MSSKANKVIFYEAFEEEQRALKQEMPAQIEAVYFRETIQETGHTDPPARVICVRTQSVIPLKWAESLSGVLTRSTGYDHLEAYKSAVRKDIPCGHLPSYCSRAVAEHAILMVMALWRKIPQQTVQVKTFSRDGLTGQECRGKNLVVVGVGRIGTEILNIAAALGINIKGVDIDPREQNVDYVSFAEGMGWADAVVSAVPLTEETRGMFNFAVFQKMKPSVVFVNISRGEVAPLPEVKGALEENRIAGAALDVYDNEERLGAALRGRREEGSPSVKMFRQLLKRTDVILTPHNAFNTREAVQRKARQSIASLEQFFSTGHFVDPTGFLTGHENDKRA